MARLASTLRTRLGTRESPPAGDDPPPGQPHRPPVVSLEDVHKRYGEGAAAVDALRGVSLEIPRSSFAVLLGPSGSGKTTLLNLVGAIEPPTSGRLTVDGVDLQGLDGGAQTTFRREHIGFVFQFFNLVPTLTALENVLLVAELVGAGRKEAEDALDAVGLAERAGHFPSALSGGEQQRVAVARAVVKSPPLLLCDEPTGSLDLATGQQVLATLRDMNAKRGISVVLVTHNQAIATMADVVVHMGSGLVTSVEPNANPRPATEVIW